MSNSFKPKLLVEKVYELSLKTLGGSSSELKNKIHHVECRYGHNLQVVVKDGKLHFFKERFESSEEVIARVLSNKKISEDEIEMINAIKKHLQVHS